MSGKRVAAYIRAATLEAARDQLVSQNMATGRWSHSRGYEVVGVYADLGLDTSDERPGLQRLLNDARAGKFEAVIVVDLALLCRQSAALRAALNLLQDELGVEVWTINSRGGDA